MIPEPEPKGDGDTSSRAMATKPYLLQHKYFASEKDDCRTALQKHL